MRLVNILKKQIISLFLILFPLIASSKDAINYNFSVQFYSKMCEVVVPNTIILSKVPDAEVTSSIDIKNKLINVPFFIQLEKCSSSKLDDTGVFLSQGNTLSGTNNFFNNKSDGNIGVQIKDMITNKIIAINTSSSIKPSEDSVVWNNVTSANERKQLIASLLCKTDNCEPDTGNFSASVTFSFYVN